MNHLRVFAACALLAFSATAQAGHQGDRNSATTISCTPDPTSAFQAVTCTATVSDEYGTPGQRAAPQGIVNFSVITGPGSFSPSSCTLEGTAQGPSSCSVTYTPSAGGVHQLEANYEGAVGPFSGVWHPSSGSTTLTVNNPVPTITSIIPGFGNVGDTLGVTINGTGFASAGITVSLGAGITVDSVNWINSTELNANITIGGSAVTGLRDVTVTNPAPSGGSATLADGFEVRNPVPVITSLSPSAVEEGYGTVEVTVTGDNFVNDSVAYFNGIARDTSFVSSTELRMLLDAADTAAVGDYDVHVNNPAPGGGDSNTALFSVVLSGGSFNVVEIGQDVNGRLFTKLAGVTFGVDVLATDVGRTAINTSFTGNVLIELLDAGDDSGPLDANGCRTSWTVAQNLGTYSFAGGDNGRINVAFSHADAIRVARVRVSHPAVGAPTHVGCASDAFSVRPQALTLTTTLSNAGTSGTPVHAAGDAFTLTAAALAGYDGTPQIDPERVLAHTGSAVDGTLSGNFPAANPAFGESSDSGFSYNEVGNFTLEPVGIYDGLPGAGVHDRSFTAVDQPDDCTDDFSNSAVGGQYGCYFGNTDLLVVGRFVPAYFETTVVQGCDSEGFTYSGQPFEVTVTARNAAGSITRNFNYSATPSENFAKDVTLSDKGDDSRFDAPDNTVFADFFGNGEATVSNVIYRFSDPETEFAWIDLRAIDTDDVSSAGHIEDFTEIRSGRLAMENASALTSDNGIMNVIVQAWQEVSPGVHDWMTHTDDQACTVLGTSDFSLDPVSYSGNLEDGETAIINFNYVDGEGTLVLSVPGVGNYGSVRVDVDVDDWLFFDWDSNGPEAPYGIMRFFEVFSTEPGFIFRDEVIN